MSTSANPVFDAIADPSRRRVLDLLSRGEQAAGQLLRHFDFSQPALSRHLRVLREAGLVVVRPVGRERRYSLNALALRGVHDWLSHYRRFWTERLDDLGQLLDDPLMNERPDQTSGATEGGGL